MVTAAVLHALNEDLKVHDTIEIDEPRSGEVRVKVIASGVCHSDVSVQNGTMALPTPMVLGHEGAGVIEAVGPDVTDRAVGDHVVLTFVPACGECTMCERGQSYLCDRNANTSKGGLVDGSTRLTLDGEPLHQMAMCGTYANHAIVPAISTVKIDADIDLRFAALIGCGVLTGVGAAINTADIRPGGTVAVIGCGGVGLNVIQGARLAGAGTIIAIDTFESKLDLARRFGATHTIEVAEGVNPVKEVFGLTGRRGVDTAFEVIGLEATINQAMNMTRAGGEVVLVGVPRFETQLTINPALTFLYQAKTVKGCWYGSANVHTDVPKLLEWYRSGELLLEELVSQEIGVGQVNDAFAQMASGEVARSLIIHQH